MLDRPVPSPAAPVEALAQTSEERPSMSAVRGRRSGEEVPVAEANEE